MMTLSHPRSAKKLKLPSSVKGKHHFKMVSAEEMESISKGFGKEHEVGSFKFSAVNGCMK